MNDCYLQAPGNGADIFSPKKLGSDFLCEKDDWAGTFFCKMNGGTDTFFDLKKLCLSMSFFRQMLLPLLYEKFN